MMPDIIIGSKYRFNRYWGVLQRYDGLKKLEFIIILSP